MKLSWSTVYETLTPWRKYVSREEAIWGVNMYLIWWLPENLEKTPSDQDIISKNYFVVDLDIRDDHHKATKEILTQEELKKEINKIKFVLDEDQYRKNYNYIVCTGNWAQIRYIWDDVDLHYYSMWLERLYENFDRDILWWTHYKTDKSMKNLARMARLPWSINRKDKRWLWDLECHIMHKGVEKSWCPIEIVHWWKIVEEEINKKKELIKNKKSERVESDTSIYNMINNISCAELFQKNKWLELARDWKNFISDRDWHYISGFYDKESNCICFSNPWSRHNDSWETCFTPYHYIKMEILWSGWDKEVFERAKENYSDIKKQDDINKKNFLENKSEMDKVVHEITQDWPIFANLWYVYPDWPFEHHFWTFKSWELFMVASASNQWKTSFVLQTLKANKLHPIAPKIWAVINMEFDLDDWFRYDWLRTKWFKNSEVKKIGTDLRPFTEEEEIAINAYVHKRRNEIKIIDKPQNTNIDDIFETLLELAHEWVSCVAIDSLSSIEWVSDDYKTQVNALKKFRNFCTKTWMFIILIHHFNKTWKEYSGSWKIKDLCNGTIEIFPATDNNWERYRRFELTKDKPHNKVMIANSYYHNWIYMEVPEEDLDD